MNAGYGRAALVVLMLAQPVRAHGPSLAFEENRGQYSRATAFVARSNGFSVALAPGERSLVFQGPHAPPIRLRLRGADLTSGVPRGEDRAVGEFNYLRGKDPALWQTHVPTFHRVVWPGVYPGVDLILRGNPGDLEVDFAVAPGASTRPIEWVVSPGATLRRLPDGSLQLRASDFELRLGAPRSLERQAGGHELALRSGYQRRGGGAMGFQISGRKPQHPLLIDPVIVAASYLSGTATADVNGAATDAAGNVYFTGIAYSADFPSTNGSTRRGGSDAYITKLDPTGQTILFSSFLGGTADDGGHALAVTSGGSVLIAGHTFSVDFPVSNAFQNSYNAGKDGFVARLAPDGASLEFSTYLGGSGDEQVDALALDEAGNVYVTGSTVSSDFPALNPQQAALSGGTDGFVASLSATGALRFSTFLGGTGTDTATTLRATPAGALCVAGQTSSSNFPVVGAAQATNAGGGGDAFVSLYTSTGALTRSTYWGGSGLDGAASVGINANGDCYVGGTTASSDFPAVGTALAGYGGNPTAFLARFNAGGGVQRSAFVTAGTLAALSVDSRQGVFITGTTQAGLALVLPVQATYGGDPGDAFLAHVAPADGPVDFASYLGGAGKDIPFGLALAGSGVVFVGGITSSPNFPVLHPFQSAKGAGDSGFVAAIALVPAVTTVMPSSGPAAGGTRVSLAGGYLEPGDTVLLDGLPLTDVTIADSTHASGLTPPHAAGAVDVLVLRQSLGTTLPHSFTYLDDENAPGLEVPGSRRGPFQVGWSCQSGPGPLTVTLALGPLCGLYRRRRTC